MESLYLRSFFCEFNPLTMNIIPKYIAVATLLFTSLSPAVAVENESVKGNGVYKHAVDFVLSDGTVVPRASLTNEMVQEAMAEKLESLRKSKYFIDRNIRVELHQELEKFYENRNYSLAWLGANQPLDFHKDLQQAMANAWREGLEEDNYEFEQITPLMREVYNGKPEVDINKMLELDLWLTSAYMTYGTHLLQGRIDPSSLNKRWHAEPRSVDMAAHLQQAIEKRNIEQSLMALNPPHEAYSQLRNAFLQYKEIADNGGWPTVPQDPENKVFEKGDTSESIAVLSDRLRTEGDYNVPDLSGQDPYVYDEYMEMAIEKFQKRYGLKVDGLVGPSTLAALNVSAEDRAEQIRLNMERMRWLPEDFAQNAIVVNVPEYKLRVYEGGNEVMEMKVVVGREYRSTPVFNDQMQYLEFSPTWNVPMSIARKDILPALKKDPGYASRNNFEIYPNWNEDAQPIDPYSVDWEAMSESDFGYRVVQQPGPSNSLGQVKFMFPNNMAIYLHDTPAEHLFDRTERTYSSGCIRVERPVELADYILEDHNRSQIRDLMNEPNPKAVTVNGKDLAVQIVYKTAWVDEEGVVNFRDDIYGHDETQLAAIEKKEDSMQ